MSVTREKAAFFNQSLKALLFAIVVAGISVVFEPVSAAPAYCTSSAALYQCVAPGTNCASLGSTMVGDSACDTACNGGWKYCGSQAPTPPPTAAPASATGVSSAAAAGGATCGAGFSATAGVCFPTDTGLPDPADGIAQILGNFFSWLLIIFGFLAVGAFVISGIQYLVSAGDEDMAKTAKRNMKWSIIGVIVGLSGWIIMQAVANALTAQTSIF
ncbi:MAG: pilin [Candidatus Moranbacteria bacterium]|nr:pilin [Candidatus Moranbacteria bacterium]